jgi:hypothetical protein
MQQHVIQCQIRAFSLLAEIEGMKAENSLRESINAAQAYSSSDFMRISNQLEELAREAGQVY